jgi:ribosomal protein S18 acetylase RimI-like enzyme
LRLIEATVRDLDRIMDLERQGFAAGNRESRSTYAQRIASFPQGSLMAWLGSDCVGCVFSEIWRSTPQPDVAQFTLGHDVREQHDPVAGSELYISSMTLAPTVRGQGLGTPLLLGCMAQVARAFPGVAYAVLLVNTNWTVARRIYARAGFVEVARFGHFFAAHDADPADGIVMRRPLVAPVADGSGACD